MKGVYQHCAHNHLHRYLAEFDFRYNNRVALGVQDSERADKLLKGAVGKRLTYNPAQSARFIKAAKALGADESGKAFEEACALWRSASRKPVGAAKPISRLGDDNGSRLPRVRRRPATLPSANAESPLLFPGGHSGHACLDPLADLVVGT